MITIDSLMSDLRGLKVDSLGGRRKINYPLNTFVPRTLTSFAIVYIYEGSGTFYSAPTGNVTIHAGNVFFLFPGIEHQYGQTGFWSEYWMIFDGFIPEHYRSSGLLDPRFPVYPCGSSSELKRHWKNCLKADKELHPSRNKILSEHLFAILGTVLSAAPVKQTELDFEGTIINRIIGAMEEYINYAEFPLKALAPRFSRSYSWLRKHFTARIGCSPGRYFARMKMHTAKARLLRSGDSIKVIASDLGFDDPYHFSRRFKTLEGLSPEHFRQSFS